MTTLKTAFIQLVDSLKSTKTPATRTTLENLSSALKDTNIQIPETEESKNQISYLIFKLFAQEPSLMNPGNKALLEQFQAKMENKISHSPSRQK